MRRSTSIFLVTVLMAGMLGPGVAAAAEMNAAALKAYAGKPWDKAALMHTTVDVGTYKGVPVVAEFPCSDVCPQYTKRIIHYRLPADTSCASVGGLERQVLVPIAIAVREKTFCVPRPLVASGEFDGK